MLLGAILVLSVLLPLVGCLTGGAFLSLAWLWALPVGMIGTFLGLVLVAFLVLWISCLVVKTDVPQENDSRYYRFLTKLYAEAILQFFGIRICGSGHEKVPGEGRFVLVCNHNSNADPVLLLHAFSNSQLAFISKRENSTMFLVGKVMHKLLCQLVNRENDREALKTILKCIQLLKEDKVSVGIFPEGYIHKDHKLHHFRHGVLKVAQKAKVPIVVCTMKDTHHVIPDALHFKRPKVELNVLAVLPAEEVAAANTVELSERIYAMMAQDLGPDRVAAEAEAENA